MINFKKPKDSPNPYCTVILSDNTEAYEHNSYSFWRELKKYCDEKKLTVKSVYIVYNGQKKEYKKNHPVCYFIIYDGKFSLRGGSVIRKGYGIVCLHPGNIKRTYISWYDTSNGKFVYNEVLRGNNRVYEEEIGIQPTKH